MYDRIISLRGEALGPYDLLNTATILLMCLYLARKAIGHVYVLMIFDFFSFWDVYVIFWNCSDSVVYLFVFHNISKGNILWVKYMSRWYQHARQGKLRLLITPFSCHKTYVIIKAKPTLCYNCSDNLTRPIKMVVTV